MHKMFMLEDKFIVQWGGFLVHISKENTGKWGHSSVVEGLPDSILLVQVLVFLLCPFYIFHRIKLYSSQIHIYNYLWVILQISGFCLFVLCSPTF